MQSLTEQSDFSGNDVCVVREQAAGYQAAFFLLRDLGSITSDPEEHAEILRVQNYCAYRFNQVSLAHSPEFAPTPWQSSKRECEDCEGTGCVCAGPWSNTADRMCDECNGKGYIGGVYDFYALELRAKAHAATEACA